MTEAVYEDLFSELVATVRVPKPLVITKDIVLECPSKGDVLAINSAATEEDAQKIIFGDQLEAATELFNGKPAVIWNAFMDRWNKHFFGDADAGK